jgi:hypothetical protein
MPFRWTEVQLPLLKQGAPTKLGVDDTGGLSSDSHADNLAPATGIPPEPGSGERGAAESGL